MYTFRGLGNKGNLGNQLFQIAAISSLAIRAGHQYSFPEWKYEKYFSSDLPRLSGNIELTNILEKQFHYYEWEKFESKKNINLYGWFQSEKYFNPDHVRDLFKFDEDFVSNLIEKFHYVFDKKTILVSVRRGDFVNHPRYYQLSYKYYFSAIIENFPDWKQRNIVFISDDNDYCKKHFSFIKNTFFMGDLSPIEQMALGSLCDDYVISNSSFSWWTAWLGEKKDTKIIRPYRYFRGRFSDENDDSDYFPERWLMFSEKNKFLSLNFLMLVSIGEYYRLREYTKTILKYYLCRLKS